MEDLIRFVCPQCRAPLALKDEEYRCCACARLFPVVLGIPDFRVFPDPYISYTDDYEKGKFLLENSRHLDFEGLVQLYWKITPHVSADRARRFMRSTFALVEKSARNLEAVKALRLKKDGERRFDSVLEIGCGTGGFLVAAHGKFQRIVGVDIAFRWLIVARKRLEERGIKVPLVCACAEHLPFADESFDLVAGEAVLEHVRDQRITLRECHRVLTPEGSLFLATPNRFSIMPEPHVRVWGVGYLPRKWMNAYVNLVKGIPYQHVRLLSYAGLRKLLRSCSLHNHRILLPSASARQWKDVAPLERLQIKLYEIIRNTPLIRLLLYVFGPYFHVVCSLDKGYKKALSGRIT